MAEHFVKIYGSILSSSIWLEDDATRLVWITMLAKADEEGCVWASVGGLAHSARVSRDKCKRALEVLSSPDEDSRDGTDGRRIVKIERGWRVLNREKYANMRTKRQIQTAKRVAQWRDRQRTVVTSNEVTADQDSISISTSGSEEKGSRARARGVEPAESIPTVHHTLRGWKPPPELEGEAEMAGVPREVFRERLAELANGPIGGRRGVLDREKYVRAQFGKWRTWAEEQRARRAPDPNRPMRGSELHAYLADQIANPEPGDDEDSGPVNPFDDLDDWQRRQAR
jgi:hypothetical protein